MLNKKIFCRGSEQFEQVLKTLHTKGCIESYVPGRHKRTSDFWYIKDDCLLVNPNPAELINAGFVEVTPDLFLWNYNPSIPIDERFIYCKGGPQLLKVLKKLQKSGISIDPVILNDCSNYYCSDENGTISGYHNSTLYELQGKIRVGYDKFEEIWLKSKYVKKDTNYDFIGFYPELFPEANLDLLDPSIRIPQYVRNDFKNSGFIVYASKCSPTILDGTTVSGGIQIVSWQQFLSRYGKKNKTYIGFISSPEVNLNLLPKGMNSTNLSGQSDGVYYINKRNILDCIPKNWDILKDIEILPWSEFLARVKKNFDKTTSTSQEVPIKKYYGFRGNGEPVLQGLFSKQINPFQLTGVYQNAIYYIKYDGTIDCCYTDEKLADQIILVKPEEIIKRLLIYWNLGSVESNSKVIKLESDQETIPVKFKNSNKAKVIVEAPTFKLPIKPKVKIVI